MNGPRKWAVGKISGLDQWYATNPVVGVTTWFDTWREAFDYASGE